MPRRPPARRRSLPCRRRHRLVARDLGREAGRAAREAERAGSEEQGPGQLGDRIFMYALEFEENPVDIRRLIPTTRLNCRLSVARAGQADGVDRPRARVGAASAAALSAPSASNWSSIAGSLRNSSSRVAQGREQRDQRVGQRRLERAEALAGKAGEDLLDALAGDGGIDADQVAGFGTRVEQLGIVGQRLGIGLRLADLLRDQRRRCRSG